MSTSSASDVTYSAFEDHVEVSAPRQLVPMIPASHQKIKALRARTIYYNGLRLQIASYFTLSNVTDTIRVTMDVHKRHIAQTFTV